MFTSQRADRKTTFGHITDYLPSEDPKENYNKLQLMEEKDLSKTNLRNKRVNELPTASMKHEKEYESTDNESKMLKVRNCLMC